MGIHVNNNYTRNYSGVLSQKTAASSNLMRNQYSSAVIGGSLTKFTDEVPSQLNHMNRLVHTGNARTSSKWPKPASTGNRRHSTTLGKRQTVHRPSVQDAYQSATNFIIQDKSRAYSSQGYRSVLQTKMQKQKQGTLHSATRMSCSNAVNRLYPSPLLKRGHSSTAAFSSKNLFNRVYDRHKSESKPCTKNQ